MADFTLAESTILPLLWSMTHAMAATLKAVEELRLQTSDLEAHVAHSLPEVTDYSTPLNQIQSSLHDLSHRVPHLPPAHVSAPLQTQSSRPCPLVVPSPHAPPARGAPPQPPKGPIPSFAAIVGGTSAFDQVARENMTARMNRGKKNPAANTSATKVAEASKKASLPKPPGPIASAAKRSFAPRLSPGPHLDATDIKAHLPDLAASVL